MVEWKDYLLVEMMAGYSVELLVTSMVDNSADEMVEHLVYQ
jgi:hypothetical protein